MTSLLLLCSWLAFAESPSVDVEATPVDTWSDAEIVQQRIPDLEGELSAIQAQIVYKKGYFTGEYRLADAFWQWDVTTLSDMALAKGLQLELVQAHQERLLNHFDQRPFADPDGAIAKRYRLIEKSVWQAEIERDALDIRFLNGVIAVLQEHNSIVERLKVAAEDWSERVKKLSNEGPDSAEKIVLMMQQRKQFLDLLIFCLELWMGNPQPIQTYMETLLQVDTTNPILAESVLLQLNIVSSIIQDAEFKTRITTRLTELASVQAKLDAQKRQQYLQKVEQEWTVKVANLDLKQVESLKIQLDSDFKDADISKQEEIKRQQQIVDARHTELTGIAVEADLLRAQQQQELERQRLAELEQEETQNAQKLRVQEEVLRLRNIETNLRTNESIRHQTVQKSIESLTERYAVWNAQREEWQQLPPLDSSRKSTLMTLKQDLHQLRWDSQDTIQNLDLEGDFEQVLSSMEAVEVQGALEAIEDAQNASVQHRYTEQSRLIGLWVELGQQINDLGSLDIETAQFWSDIVFEWRYLPATFRFHWSNIQTALTDINQMIRLLKQIVQWVLLIGLWLWLAKRFQSWWIELSTWINNQDRPAFLGELGLDTVLSDTLSPEVSLQQSIAKQVFHVCVSVFMLMLVQGTRLSVIAWLILLFTSFHLSKPLVRKWITNPKIENSLLQGLRTFIWLFVGLNVVSTLFEYGFYVQQSVYIVDVIKMVTLGVLLFIQLGTWSVLLQEKANETIGLNRSKAWMERWSAGWIGKRIRSLFAVGILFWDWCSRVVFWFVEHSSLFGSVLAKSALEQDDALRSLPTVDTSDWQLDWDGILSPWVTQVEEVIQQDFGGVTCIIADEGMGKSAVLKRVLDSHGDSTKMLAVAHIVRDENWTTETLLVWLSEQFDVPPQQDFTTLSATVRSQPSMLIGIDDIQRVFLRGVQGFEVINRLFDFIQGTATKHCWLLTCHAATWNFLSSPSTPVRTDFLRHVFPMKPLSVSQVRSVILGSLAEQSLTIDFSTVSALDNPQSIYRSEMAFWRLLVDSTKGNLSTARQVFCSSVVQTNDSSTVGVRMFALNQNETLHRLDDGVGFVLACVLMHNRCTLNEIVHSLQMNQQVVISICRQLVTLGICIETGDRYQVDLVWYPWVEAYLWQKRFIGKGG